MAAVPFKLYCPHLLQVSVIEPDTYADAMSTVKSTDLRLFARAARCLTGSTGEPWQKEDPF
jgi:hypothetical protein